MNLRLLPLVAVLAWSFGSTPVPADEKKPAPAAKTAKASPEKPDAEAKPKEPLPDYIRFVEDDKSARLEIAVKTFRMPSGATVDLIGVVHIADADYYAELNRRFPSYDAVLFELVGDPKLVTEKTPAAKKEEEGESGGSAIRFIQTSAGRLLKLSFQLGQIDYTLPNMVHADTTGEEFTKMQKERGESMLKLFMRAMKAQMSGELDDVPVHELDTFGLLRILMSRDSAAEFKIVLAKMFDHTESMTAIMEGPDGSAILSGRNEVVMKKIREVLSDKSKRRISVFYGAAHMPGLEKMMLRDLKATPAGEEWLAAWTIPKTKAEPAKPTAESPEEPKKPAPKP